MYWNVPYHLQCCSSDDFWVPNRSPVNVAFFYNSWCFFTSSKCLRSYKHAPNEVKPVPRVNSSGWVQSATFEVVQRLRSPACLELGVLRTCPCTAESYALWPFFGQAISYWMAFCCLWPSHPFSYIDNFFSSNGLLLYIESLRWHRFYAAVYVLIKPSLYRTWSCFVQ